MLTPPQIKRLVEKRYPDLLRATVTGEPFFPLPIRFGQPKPSDSYETLRREVGALRDGSKEQLGYGYTVTWEIQATRRYGNQTLPTAVFIADADDLVRWMGKEAEYAAFCDAVAGILAQYPKLRDWLAQQPTKLLPHLGHWRELLLVCDYLLANPRPMLYLRELPLPLHTKFVEWHQAILHSWLDVLLPPDAILPDESRFEPRFGLRYDEPLLRLRLLDPALQRTLAWPASDLSAPLSAVAALPLAGKRVVIVENKMTFLTLPPVADGVALWGGGFRVGLVRALPWLATCPLWYWGDIDTHGFAILSQLRSRWPHARSLLMDRATVERLADQMGTGTAGAPLALPHLTAAESALYAWLHAHNHRLEQEKIPQTMIAEAMAVMG